MVASAPMSKIRPVDGSAGKIEEADASMIGVYAKNIHEQKIRMG